MPEIQTDDGGSPSPRPSPAGRGGRGEHTRLACGFRRPAGIVQRLLTIRALGGAPKAAREGACAPLSFSLREKVAAGRMRVKRWMFFCGGYSLSGELITVLRISPAWRCVRNTWPSFAFLASLKTAPVAASRVIE